MKIFALLLTAILTGCAPVVNRSFQGEAAGREWTVIVYMAADNDLESAAIADLKELEAVNYGNAPVSVLVLLDRSPYYDMTNGDWSDTRLFEVKYDSSGISSTIKSVRLDCPELGLSVNGETELNTADPAVLSKLIDFAARAYPAEKYALFVWGHGTGWRGGGAPAAQKAVAFDDTSGQYMTLPAFGKAVEGKGLSVIGFDTCYGALLEVAYQIKNDAELFIGSEGPVMSGGWDYATLFSEFLSKPALSVEDLGNSIQLQFTKQYKSTTGATISQIKLSEVNNLFDKFNKFAGITADAIETQLARDKVLAKIFSGVESYYFSSFPCDLYIDIGDFRKKMTDIRFDITENEDMQDAMLAASAELENALNLAIPSSWAWNNTACKIGVHFIPVHGVAVPAAIHEQAYIRGSMSIDKGAFVENSTNWVPNFIPANDSFLDKMFYWVY